MNFASIRRNSMPTYVITGASCGIGLELARQLSARGDKVYATVRAKAASAVGDDDVIVYLLISSFSTSVQGAAEAWP